MFVQIGRKAFNPELVTEVWFFNENRIEVYFESARSADSLPVMMVFEDEDAELFKKWWDEKAEVYVVT